MNGVATTAAPAVPLAVLAMAVLLAGLAAGPPATRRTGPAAGRSSPRRRGLAADPRAGHLYGLTERPPAGRLSGLAAGPRGGLAAGATAVRRGGWRRLAGVAALPAVVAATVAPGLAVVPLGLAAAGLLAVRAARRRSAARRQAARAAAAPAVLDLLGAGLLAGLNPHLAVLRVAERAPDALREELAEAAAVLRLGATPAAALRTAAERSGLDELRAAAAALEVAERWGAPPAEALAARAGALRTRARLRAEAEAGRAAVRLAFPLVLCFLPAFVLTNVEVWLQFSSLRLPACTYSRGAGDGRRPPGSLEWAAVITPPPACSWRSLGISPSWLRSCLPVQRSPQPRSCPG